jgi:hypothetical protein
LTILCLSFAIVRSGKIAGTADVDLSPSLSAPPVALTAWPVAWRRKFVETGHFAVRLTLAARRADCAQPFSAGTIGHTNRPGTRMTAGVGKAGWFAVAC